MYYYRARYYDANSGRFLQQDPDPGKLASPITFLSKYIYAGNNPIMFGDPSGMDFLGDIGNFIGGAINGLVNAGHDFIATLGAGLDNLLKNKTFQIICVIIAAAVIGSAVAGLFTLTGWTAVAVSAGVGGLVGGFSYVGLGLGTFAEGFALGALAGGLSMGIKGGEITRLWQSSWKEQVRLFDKNGWANYSFNPFIKDGPSWGSSLTTVAAIVELAKRHSSPQPPKEQ